MHRGDLRVSELSSKCLKLKFLCPLAKPEHNHELLLRLIWPSFQTEQTKECYQFKAMVVVFRNR